MFLRLYLTCLHRNRQLPKFVQCKWRKNACVCCLSFNSQIAIVLSFISSYFLKSRLSFHFIAAKPLLNSHPLIISSSFCLSSFQFLSVLFPSLFFYTLTSFSVSQNICSSPSTRSIYKQALIKMFSDNTHECFSIIIVYLNRPHHFGHRSNRKNLNIRESPSIFLPSGKQTPCSSQIQFSSPLSKQKQKLKLAGSEMLSVQPIQNQRNHI